MALDAELLEILRALTAKLGCSGPQRAGLNATPVIVFTPQTTSLSCLSTRRRSKNRSVHILLVRLRLIGDVVFTTPAIRAIRRHYPDARLTYIVEEESAAVVQDNPHLDCVLIARSPRAAGRLLSDLALITQLRRDRYDIAIDFHGGPRSSLLTWLSGAPTRIGYEVKGRSWMYTTRVPRPRVLRPQHSVVSQWDLLLPLGIAPPDPETDATEMPENPSAAQAVRQRLADAGIGPDNPIIVIHVSAGNPFRRWRHRRSWSSSADSPLRPEPPYYPHRRRRIGSR